jgi:TfoX/Sxy family transcriptional regulator of competence genes
MEPGSIPKPGPADLEYFDSIIPTAEGVTRRPMFGNVAAFANGQMFLCLFGPDVAVRLGADERERLLGIAGTSPFEPVKGRAMKEYVVLPAAWRKQVELTEEWVARSLAYAHSLPPKKK